MRLSLSSLSKVLYINQDSNARHVDASEASAPNPAEIYAEITAFLNFGIPQSGFSRCLARGTPQRNVPGCRYACGGPVSATQAQKDVYVDAKQVTSLYQNARHRVCKFKSPAEG